jgi:hypothetical protein
MKALNQAAHEHANLVDGMRLAGLKLADHVRQAVEIERLSVTEVAHLTGLDEQLVQVIVGDQPS